MKISIITATLNASNVLEEAIRSISTQRGVSNIEHIVIDGESTDETVAIIKKHAESISYWVSEKDNGIYDAMNKGIKVASGDIIGILNADDFYFSETVLSDILAVFNESSIDACYGNLVYVDDKKTDNTIRYWKAGHFAPSRFYYGWMPPHPSFFVRRSVYEKYGLFNLDLGSAADYEIMLRFLLKNKVKVHYIPKTLVKMRTGGVSNASIKNRLKANKMDRIAWKVNGLSPYPWTIIIKPLRKLSQWMIHK